MSSITAVKPDSSETITFSTWMTDMPTRPATPMIGYFVFAMLASPGIASADAGSGGLSLIMSLFAIAFLVFDILLMISTSKAFGKGGGFAVGLIFLSFIFLPILAFSKEIRYIGPDGIGAFDGGFVPQGYSQPMPGDAPQEGVWR